jgi:hypothetical protein
MTENDTTEEGPESTLPAVVRWRVAVRDSDLDPTARHVALTLSLRMNADGGSCHPSIATLAADTGRSERTVQVALGVLRDAGWLAIDGGGGRQRTNHYRATTPKKVQRKPRNPRTLSPETVQEEPRNGCTVSPEVEAERVQPLQERVQNPTEKGAVAAPEVVLRKTRGSNPTPLGPPPSLNIDVPAAPAATPRRKHQLPETWEPTDAHRRFANEHGIDLDIEVPRFRRYYLAKGDPFRDWNHVFRNWLDRADRPRNGNRPRDHSVAVMDTARTLIDRYEAEEAAR